MKILTTRKEKAGVKMRWKIMKPDAEGKIQECHRYLREGVVARYT